MLNDHVDVVDVDVVGPVGADLGLVDLGQDDLGEARQLGLVPGGVAEAAEAVGVGGRDQDENNVDGLGDALCDEAGDTGCIEEGRVIYMMVVVGVDTEAQELLGDDVEGVAPTGL